MKELNSERTGLEASGKLEAADVHLTEGQVPGEEPGEAVIAPKAGLGARQTVLHLVLL